MDQEAQLDNTPRALLMDIARKSGLWIAVLSLGVAVAMFLISANQFIDIWFKDQYVPVARMVIALAIGAGAIAVIWRLTKR